MDKLKLEEEIKNWKWIQFREYILVIIIIVLFILFR
jgi:hypothetical protein